MPTTSLLWQYASLPTMVQDTFKEPKAAEPKAAEQIVAVEPIKTVRDAIRSRRLTIKKNGRYSRVKTRRRHLN